MHISAYIAPCWDVGSTPPSMSILSLRRDQSRMVSVIQRFMSLCDSATLALSPVLRGPFPALPHPIDSSSTMTRILPRSKEDDIRGRVRPQNRILGRFIGSSLDTRIASSCSSSCDMGLPGRAAPRRPLCRLRTSKSTKSMFRAQGTSELDHANLWQQGSTCSCHSCISTA